ncbi:MAG: hypothetical protein H0T63_08020 [Pyrinomonadaceae bacterium]|nr:hypothetical protein [Pyrinomonadaceae bacterium]
MQRSSFWETLKFFGFMTHECGWESLGLSTFAKSQHDELEAAVNAFKNYFAILEAEQAGDFVFTKKHFAQLLRSQVSVYPARKYDSAIAAIAQQVHALLAKEAIQVRLIPNCFSVYNSRLVGKL